MKKTPRRPICPAHSTKNATHAKELPSFSLQAPTLPSSGYLRPQESTVLLQYANLISRGRLAWVQVVVGAAGTLGSIHLKHLNVSQVMDFGCIWFTAEHAQCCLVPPPPPPPSPLPTSSFFRFTFPVRLFRFLTFAYIKIGTGMHDDYGSIALPALELCDSASSLQPISPHVSLQTGLLSTGSSSTRQGKRARKAAGLPVCGTMSKKLASVIADTIVSNKF